MGEMLIGEWVDISSAAGKEEAIAGEHVLQDESKRIFPCKGRTQRHEDDLAADSRNGLDASGIGRLHTKLALRCRCRPGWHQNGRSAHPGLIPPVALPIDVLPVGVAPRRVASMELISSLPFNRWPVQV